MLNLGMLQFGLGIDTRGLTAALAEVERFGRTVQGAQTAANRGFQTSIGMLRRQENALLGGLEKVRSLQEKINNTTLAPTVKMNFINQLNAAYSQLSANVTSAARGLDPTKIDRAVTSFNQLGNEINRSFTGMARSTRESEQAIERQTAALFRARQAALDLGAAIDRSRAPNLGLQGSAQRQQLQTQIEGATQRFATQMSGPAVSASQAKEWERQWRESINNVKRKFQELGGQMPADTIEAWRKGFHSLGAAALVLQGHLGGMSTRMFALSSIIRDNGLLWGSAAAGVVGFTGVLVNMGRAAIESRLVLEKLTFALTAVQGSTMAAAGALEYVRTVSDRAGLAVQSVGSSYMRLTAAGKAAGMATDEVNNIFETFAMASGTLALSAEDAQGVFRALDQIMSKGTVQAEELRGQLGDRLPGAFAIAANAMGVTTAQLNKMMKDGEVLSRDFLPKFAEEVKKAFGIDVGSNIETMQASMQRLSNSWLFFGQAVDQTFGITNAWIRLLNTTSNVLDTLSKNMDVAVKWVGALAGAMVGLAAAMIAPAVLGAIGAGFATVTAAITAMRTATMLATSAQMALYAVMALTPWGAIAAIIARIAAVLLGAKLGFELAERAAAGLNSAMGDTSEINAYIQRQKALGQQVDMTTNAYIRQAMVIARTSKMAMLAARDEWRATKEVGAGDVLASGAAFRRSGQLISPDTFRQQRRQSAQQRLTETMDTVHAQTRMLNELVNLKNLPSPGGTPMDPLSKEDKGKKNKAKSAADEAREAVEKLLDALRNAEMAMDLLFVQTPDFRAVDALMEAKELLQGMSEEELTAFAKEMGMAGASAEDLEVAVAAIIGKTNDAKDAVQEFRNVFEDIRDTAREMEGQQSLFNFLAGGGSESGEAAIEALNEANDQLFQLSLLGEAGERAMAALKLQLEALGYTGATTAEALAAFNLQQKKLAEGIEGLREVRKAWEEVGEETYRAQVLLEAYSRGTAVGEAAERMLDLADKVNEYRENLEKAQQAGQDTSGWMSPEAYAEAIAGLDRVQQELERTKEKMAEFKAVWQDTWRDAYDNVIAVAEGSKSVLEALTDTLMGFVDRMAQNAIDFLSEQSFDALFGGANADQQASGILAAFKPKQTGAQLADQSMNQLSLSANIAAEALRHLAMSTGGFGMSMSTVTNSGLLPLDSAADSTTMAFQGVNPALGQFGNFLLQILSGAGGGSGGGIGAALIQGALSIGGALFGGGGAGVGSGVTPPSGFSGYVGIGSYMGRALGGPVTHGWAYEVGEQGAGTEVFIPGTSGYIGKPRDAAPSTTVDMSTYIDARGATPDAVAMLEQKMLAREARQRAMLPHIIDARTRENRQRLRN